jgi:glycosyltransferase involved in cell wall biosynthesis
MHGPGERQELALSVVAPAHDEEGNIDPLVEAVGRAAGGLARDRAWAWELILVDDGSRDGTRARIEALMRDRPWLRAVAMTRTPPGRGAGQSAAFWAGFRAARGRLIATLDADLQNDPADIPRLVAVMEQQRADLAQGDRSRNRRDNLVRRVGSVVGRAFRRMILGDTVRDTGCSLRVMKREVALALPLEFRGVHRFIPVLARRLGFVVVEAPVSHRPRQAGVTKYGLGIRQRAIPGLIDCFAVRWMISRRRWTDHVELERAASARPARSGAGAEALL